MGKRINATDFALYWDKAKSPAEVADHFGIDEIRAKQKASQFRRKGVPLKKFARVFPGNSLDWEALTEKVKQARIDRGEDPDEEVVVAVKKKAKKQPKVTK